MSLPRAGVRSDFRRFEELHDKCDKVDTALTAFKLSSTLQLGDLQRLETIATNLVDAINELLMQIKEKTSYGVVSGLEVTEQDEPDMTVNVAEGTIYMQNGDRFEVDTDVITVDTADTTNARKDIIYVSSTGEITYLAGTAAEVPEAPSTPTGGLILAEIAVAANATAIETENITDKRKLIVSSGRILESYSEKLVTLSGTSTTINLSLGNVFTHSLTGNTTYTISNAISGQAHSFTLIITQTATVRTITFPASVKWQGGEIPDMTTASKTYVLTFMTIDGGTNWLGMFGGEF